MSATGAAIAMEYLADGTIINTIVVYGVVVQLKELEHAKLQGRRNSSGWSGYGRIKFQVLCKKIVFNKNLIINFFADFRSIFYHF